MAKIISCEDAGQCQTYDLEVDDPEHQYFLANGILSSNSHAYVYAYNSYHCAWLQTYYEREWIKACLEKDPDLDKTINSVARLGYTISKPDVNYSLANEWQILNDKRCVPPLSALKGIGTVAAEELEHERGTRQFKDLYDFFFRLNDDNQQVWRWSKFNKTALKTLVQLEAFDSLLCIGEDQTFKNYAHMEKVLFVIEKNYDKLKKAVWREGRGKKAIVHNLSLATLSQADQEVKDWSAKQKINMQQELMGIFDKGLLFSSKQQQTLQKYNVRCFTEVEENPKALWFFVDKISYAMTANGKEYYKIHISDGTNIRRTVNWFKELDCSIEHNLCIAKMYKNNDWTNFEGKVYVVPE